MDSELSLQELRNLVRKQQEQLQQKDRQIAHLTRNAKKWVQKFDDHQSNVAESVIKKFELEFEHERNELHTKLLKMTELNKSLMERLGEGDAAADTQAHPAVHNAPQSATDDFIASNHTTTDDPEISMMVEPASITELEFSNEMIAQLAKYAD